MKNKTMRSILGTAVAAALLATGGANAVELSAGGTGQVLLYPYYTVENGAQTLFTVVNSTNVGKALRVNFRESVNGRTVLNFNVYLGPFDVWTGNLFALSETGGANVLTDDLSCTSPAIRTNGTLPLFGTRRYVPFRPFDYTDANNDAGVDAITRTREGYIEVIEMGTIAAGSPTAAVLGQPAASLDCSTIVTGWSTGGTWTTNATRDIGNPQGGLFGTLTVVRVDEGIVFNVPATALDNFRDSRGTGTTDTSRTIHTAPGDTRPNLSDALTSPSASLAVAEIDGATFAYPSDRAIDAVTAVLSASYLLNEFVAAQGIGASTDWVVTFPTKPFYTDPARAGTAPIRPFDRRFDAANPNGCETLQLQVFDRQQQQAQCDSTIPGGPNPCVIEACGVVSVIGLGPKLNGRTQALGSAIGVERDPLFAEGFARLSEPQSPGLRPDADNSVLGGVPAIGFSATKAINSNAQPGRLANYTVALPHRRLPAACNSGPCD